MQKNCTKDEDSQESAGAPNTSRNLFDTLTGQPKAA